VGKFSNMTTARQFLRAALLGSIATLLAAPGGGAAEISYDGCLSRARETPEQGLEQALAWRDAGGGDAARHCVAIALLNLGRAGLAAERLELLAGDMAGRPATARAEVLAQAGNAWLIAGNAARADAALSTALELAPDDPDLLIDRARALALARNYGRAFADLDRAVALAPDRVDALVFRAAARRQLDDRERALEDVELALALAPDDVDALIERGILYRLAGRDDAARADWLKVLELAPDDPAGDTARANLERLDLKPE